MHAPSPGSPVGQPELTGQANAGALWPWPAGREQSAPSAPSPLPPGTAEGPPENTQYIKSLGSPPHQTALEAPCLTLPVKGIGGRCLISLILNPCRFPEG